MAIPQVSLLTAENIQIRFSYQSCGYFTASLASATTGIDSLTIISDTARIHASASSRFEVFFDKACFDFPHSELKKFKAFLEEAKTAKEAA